MDEREEDEHAVGPGRQPDGEARDAGDDVTRHGHVDAPAFVQGEAPARPAEHLRGGQDGLERGALGLREAEAVCREGREGVERDKVGDHWVQRCVSSSLGFAGIGVKSEVQVEG